MTKKTSKKKSVTKAAPRARKTSENEVLVGALETALTGLLAAVEAGATDRRKELLARVAGSVAAGLFASPSGLSPAIVASDNMAKSVATVSVDIAEEILQRVGIGESAAPTAQEHAVPTPAADRFGVGAAA
jgi:hypothetical protein